MQVKEVEDRYKERELKWQQAQNSVDVVKATPVEVKYKSCTGDDYPSENDPHILKSSNSMNQSTTRQGSAASFKGNDSINQMRSKREYRTIETENCNFVDRKVMRKSDPPKIGRFARPLNRPVMAAPQAPLTHKRVIRDRDHAQGIKERETKKKIWS